MPKSRRNSAWKSTKDAIALLGVSEDWLYDMRTHWQKGYFWRNIQPPTSGRATYRWHVKRIEAWLEQDEAKR